jgi:hypothetical protein
MFTLDWSCLFVLWTIRSPDQRGSLSAQSLYNCADCPAGVGGPSAGAKLVWAGTVCFWALVLRTVLSHPGFGAPRPGREHNHQVCWDQVPHI